MIYKQTKLIARPINICGQTFLGLAECLFCTLSCKKQPSLHTLTWMHGTVDGHGADEAWAHQASSFLHSSGTVRQKRIFREILQFFSDSGFTTFVHWLNVIFLSLFSLADFSTAVMSAVYVVWSWTTSSTILFSSKSLSASNASSFSWGFVHVSHRHVPQSSRFGWITLAGMYLMNELSEHASSPSIIKNLK